jgi:hypothetical protein
MQAPYRLIEALLLRQCLRLGLTDGTQGEEDTSIEGLHLDASPHPLPFSSIFAIGDNPAAGEGLEV